MFVDHFSREFCAHAVVSREWYTREAFQSGDFASRWSPQTTSWTTGDIFAGCGVLGGWQYVLDADRCGGMQARDAFEMYEPHLVRRPVWILASASYEVVLKHQWQHPCSLPCDDESMDSAGVAVAAQEREAVVSNWECTF